MDRKLLNKLIQTSIFAAFMAIASPISIPIGAIPITMSLLAVFLCGAILPPLQAFFAIFVFIFLGAVGLPVFSGYEGGIGVIVGVKGGFILSYPIMVLVISYVIKIFKKRNVLSLVCGMIPALIICHSLGTLWYCRLTGIGFAEGIKLCSLPFIVPDLLKIAVAISIVVGLNKTDFFRKIRH